MKALTADEPIVITEPGVYDIPADLYHADPVPGGSLSSSGARLLLRCPALFDYARRNPPAPTPVFDFGHAAHRLVLGAGAGVVAVDADDWRTKAAKEQRDDAHAAGLIPLLAKDMAEVEAMADAIRAHPIAGKLLQPGRGRAEQSAFWVDRVTGIWCRARFDWLPDTEPDTGRLLLVDYKTTRSAAPPDLVRPSHEYGYHVQTWWYEEAARALGLAAAPILLFVFQEKTPPYLVTVSQPSPTFVNLGGLLGRQAMGIYRECVASGQWPGYSDDVELLTLPVWVENLYGSEIQR